MRGAHVATQRVESSPDRHSVVSGMSASTVAHAAVGDFDSIDYAPIWLAQREGL